MGKTELQIDITHHQMKLPILGIIYMESNCWPKGSHGNPQIIPAIVKAIGGSPQTDDKPPLLKTTAIGFTEHGGIEMVPT
jgi:hypothetical protein